MNSKDMSGDSIILKELMKEVLPHWTPISNGWMKESLEALNINSYQYIQLIVNLEERFQIEMEDEMLSYEYFKTIQDLWDAILIKCNQVE